MLVSFWTCCMICDLTCVDSILAVVLRSWWLEGNVEVWRLLEGASKSDAGAEL